MVLTDVVLDFVSGLMRNLKIAFLFFFGKIRVYRWPMFFVFDPRGYRVDGRQIRIAMESLKPGDVIARRYVNYLDGYFIPGRFSHSGVYIGDGVIVHAMGDGVQKIDVIDFLRCDGFIIFRPVPKNAEVDPSSVRSTAVKTALSYVGRTYDYNFDICEDYSNKFEVEKRTRSVYCHELTRSCFPQLDIPTVKPSLWNGMIRSRKRQFLVQSFFESPDFSVVYDSDYSDPRCSLK